MLIETIRHQTGSFQVYQHIKVQTVDDREWNSGWISASNQWIEAIIPRWWFQKESISIDLFPAQQQQQQQHNDETWLKNPVPLPSPPLQTQFVSLSFKYFTKEKKKKERKEEVREKKKEKEICVTSETCVGSLAVPQNMRAAFRLIDSLEQSIVDASQSPPSSSKLSIE